MANRFAVKSGDWHDTDVWSDAVDGTAGAEFIPGAGDVVYLNGHTIAISPEARTITRIEVAADGTTITTTAT